MRLDAKAAREDECRALATAIFKHFDLWEVINRNRLRTFAKDFIGSNPVF